MQPDELHQLFKTTFGQNPKYDDTQALAVAHGMSTAIRATAPPAAAQPSAGEQACYTQCRKTRDAALADAAAKGWPVGPFAAATAIAAFNACRHACDQHP
jgi:hypothetical protein